MRRRSSKPSQPSASPSPPSWQRSDLQGLYDALRDGARLMDRVTEAQTFTPTQEHAWRAQAAVADALVAVYRLILRTDAERALRTTQGHADEPHEDSVSLSMSRHPSVQLRVVDDLEPVVPAGPPAPTS
jgi:hypothetical protein